MTISRDRWQLHLKTRGQYYHERARELEALHVQHPDVAADTAALALHALAEVMEKARSARLTRFQHILLRLGELIAYAECAGSLARRAARSAEGKLNEKANTRFDTSALAALARIFAREAAFKVAEEGLRWVTGAGGVNDVEMTAFETSAGLSTIHHAQAGLLSDMDYIADVIFSRVKKEKRSGTARPGVGHSSYRQAFGRCGSRMPFLFPDVTANKYKRRGDVQASGLLKVCVSTRYCVEFIYALLAISGAGPYIVCVNTLLPESNLRFVWQCLTSDPTLCVSTRTMSLPACGLRHQPATVCH